MSDSDFEISESDSGNDEPFVASEEEKPKKKVIKQTKTKATKTSPPKIAKNKSIKSDKEPLSSPAKPKIQAMNLPKIPLTKSNLPPPRQFGLSRSALLHPIDA